MRIKLLLMFKNEGHLLKSWIRYHSRLVGKKNLVIFDNGSTDEETISVIRWATRNGVHIDGSFPTQQDFVNRGDMFRDIINEKTYKYRADFYVPVDCDEFLAVESAGRLKIDRRSFQSEFSKYRGVRTALANYSCLNNNPSLAGRFTWASYHMKKFFTAGNCYWLDEGFHYGIGKGGNDPVQTKIVYIHFHLKPYQTLIAHAKVKLAPYLSDFSHESLTAFVARRGPAYHCAEHLLIPEDTYYSSWAAVAGEPFPEIEAAFKRAGEPLPYSSPMIVQAPTSMDGSPPGRLWRSIRQGLRRVGRP